MPPFTPFKHAVEVVPLSEREIRVFALFSDIASKYKLCVVCPRCDQSITGENTSRADTMVVRCGCREFVWRRPVVSGLTHSV